MRQFVVECDQYYASIQVVGPESSRYWVELEGAVWAMRTGNGLNPPVKTWRRTEKRDRIESVVSEALSVVIAKVQH